MAAQKKGVKRGRPAKNQNGVHENGVGGEKSAKKAKVSTVTHRSYASLEKGTVLTLGEGDVGQLGLGPDIMEKAKPAKVGNLPDNIISVRAGGMHTVCLTSDGKVHTFGCNDEGALGRVTSEEGDESEAAVVDLDEKIVSLSAGDSHTAALTQEGVVYAWGTFRDANGTIGLQKQKHTEHKPFQMFPAGLKVVKVVSGNDHLVCLTEDGDIYTMGCAEQGQLGRVAECFASQGGRRGLRALLQPGLVHFRSRVMKFDDVWAGQHHTFAREKKTAAIYSWGLNNYYQLGFPDMVNRFVPGLVKALDPAKNWKEIAGGQHHSMALDAAGQVYVFGRKEYGRLGLGEDCEETRVPTPVPALKGKKCIRISAGTSVSIAVTDKGEIYAWGMGSSGQLGQSEDDDVWEPVLMQGKQLAERKALFALAGGQHTVVLAKDK